MTLSTQSFIAVNVGTSANDGTGDDLRTAFTKLNDNFQYMGNTGFNAANIAATNLSLSSGGRIFGDFNNATIASRTMFQTSNSNSGTQVLIIPNGNVGVGGTVAAINLEDNTSVATGNGSRAGFSISQDQSVNILSSVRGTGTYLPLVFNTGGMDRLRIDAGGNILVGNATATTYSNLTVYHSTPSTSSTTGALIVAGGVGISGNLYAGGGFTNAGAQIETGYQQTKPTANVAVAISANKNRLLLHPTGTIISFGANVTLPNTQTDGTIVSISSNVTIASLDVRPAWNGVVSVSPFGNVTNVTAGTVNRFIYIAADYVWYKIA